jgi:hypothetical protein
MKEMMQKARDPVAETSMEKKKRAAVDVGPRVLTK